MNVFKKLITYFQRTGLANFGRLAPSSQAILLLVLLSVAGSARAISVDDLTDRIANIVFIGPNAKNQIAAFKFALKNPVCASKIASTTAAQDYSLIGFIYTLKFYKAAGPMVGKIPQITDAATCQKYNPIQQLYSVIDSTAAKYGPNKLIPNGNGGQIAAGVLKQKIEEQISQGKDKLDSAIATIPVAGPILENWNCECDAAFNTELSDEAAMKLSIAYALKLKDAIANQDISKLLELMLGLGLNADQVCQLGQDLAGTSNIPVVSSVVTATCTTVLGKVLSWGVGAGQAVAGAATGAYNDVKNAVSGTPHMPGPEYYQKFWQPQIPAAVPVLSFQGFTAFDNQYRIPLWNNCFNYFTDKSKFGNRAMSSDSAKETCNFHLEGLFSPAVVDQVLKTEGNSRANIASSYDLQNIKWRADWIAKCTVPKGGWQADQITETCSNNVTNILLQGQANAVSAWQTCKNPATSSFDVNKCVQIGYNSVQNDLVNATKASKIAQDRFAKVVDFLFGYKPYFGFVPDLCKQVGDKLLDPQFANACQSTEPIYGCGKVISKISPADFDQSSDAAVQSSTAAMKAGLDSCLSGSKAVLTEWQKLASLMQPYMTGWFAQCNSWDTKKTGWCVGINASLISAFYACVKDDISKTSKTALNGTPLIAPISVVPSGSTNPYALIQPTALKDIAEGFCADAASKVVTDVLSLDPDKVFSGDTNKSNYDISKRAPRELALTDKIVRDSNGQCSFGSSNKGIDAFQLVCANEASYNACLAYFTDPSEKRQAAGCRNQDSNGYVGSPCCSIGPVARQTVPNSGSLSTAQGSSSGSGAINAAFSKLIADRVCAPQAGKRDAYDCKTAEAVQVCQALKSEGKLTDCRRVN